MGVRSILGKKSEKIREAKQKKTAQEKAVGMVGIKKTEMCALDENRWHLDEYWQKISTMLALRVAS
jgi:hypothetical protein